MVLLSGLRPDEDIRIEFTGIRPGEKLSEELTALEEDSVATHHPQIRIYAGHSAGHSAPPGDWERSMRELRQAVEARDAAAVILCLKDSLPEYNPSSHVLRRAFGKEGDRIQETGVRAAVG
jgi:FlaA1/EpsC-like NDP-sugar epimerase